MIDINIVVTSFEFTAATRSKQRTKKRTTKDRKKSIKRGRSKPGKKAARREYKRSAKAGRQHKKKSPAKKAYSESQSFSRSKKEDKRKKIMTSIFISIVIGLFINAIMVKEVVSKILVDEDFSTDPNDWDEIGEIATYDDVNEDIFIESYDHITMDRYSKEHEDLTDNDRFYFEKKINHIGATMEVNEGAYVFVGSFNKQENSNRLNSVAFGFVALRPPIGPISYSLRVYVFYGDGWNEESSLIISPEESKEYLLKLWYDGIDTFTAKIYSGAEFDVYEGGTIFILTLEKTFTINDFGAGNAHQGIYVSSLYEIDYDDAYLVKL